MQFTKGSKVGLIACSDGVRPEMSGKVQQLIGVLDHFGLEVFKAPSLFRVGSFFSGTPLERATALNQWIQRDDIMAIFDISGGDSANQILEFIDYDLMRSARKAYFGMSDLSVILNSLYTTADVQSYHYQIMNLVGEEGPNQKHRFYQTFFQGKSEAFQFNYKWLAGNQLSGIVVGGNIRCFLKLVGTKYFPNFKDKVIFLEALGGRANRIVSLLAQLHQVGAFRYCAGIILGTFSELEEHHEFHVVEQYIKELAPHVPIAKTNELGHHHTGRCIVIGQHIQLH